MSTTESVLDRHLETFGEQDMEGIMADYADDAVLITQSETYHGPDEIRRLFEALFDEFSDPEASLTLDYRTIEDDTAYIVWHADTPENEYEFATDTFVIQDGEIVTQTLGTVVTPKN
ncbi:nuclear transport factor 2 family protein [Halobacteriaceae archaeon GCM10025711]